MAIGRLALVLALGGLAAACAAPPPATLPGSEWRPVEITGQPVPPDPGMFVAFGADDNLQGDGGCNSFLATYTSGAGVVSVGPIGTTRMACAGPVMLNENAFLDALARARSFTRDRADLVLLGPDGEILARLVQTDAD